MVAANLAIRHSALRVIQLVLAQGLVHPVQIVPYLICMSTDSEELISHSADKQLQVRSSLVANAGLPQSAVGVS